MTLKEFSAEFDILYNNIASNIAPGLTEYEKSVFLTQAQEQLITEIYNGQYKGEPFEGSEEVRSYLRSIVQSITKRDLAPVTQLDFPDKYLHFRVEINSQDLWFIVFESAKLDDKCPCIGGTGVIVKPILYDEYWSISRNPFRGPNKNRAIRLDGPGNNFELISKYKIEEYTIKYIERPIPIVLEDLQDITINGISHKSECELPTVIHRDILRRAIILAKNAWGQIQEQE